MLTIYGPDWPSKRKLTDYLQEHGSGDRNVIVGWGSSHAPIPNTTGLNIVKRLNAIEQLKALKAAGVGCPDFTTDRALAQHWVKEGGLVFGRLLHHTQGQDIVGPGSEAPLRWNRKWLSREWWSKVIPNVQSEWRIHIFKHPNGEYHSIARGKKVQTEQSESRWKDIVRSRSRGWHMIHTEAPPKEVRECGRAAVKACGYDFGAVDVLLADSGVYALEINTAPGLDDYTCAKYAMAITEWTKR